MADNTVDTAKTLAEQTRARGEALGALKPRVAEVAAQLAAAPPEALTVPVLVRFMTVALRVDPKNALATCRSLMDRVVAARPQDADLLALRSQVTVMNGELTQAIAQYQEIIDLPPKPVSWQGLRLFDIKRRGCLKYRAKETGTDHARQKAQDRLSQKFEGVIKETIETVILPRRRKQEASRNESAEEVQREFAAIHASLRQGGADRAAGEIAELLAAWTAHAGAPGSP